MTTGNPNPTPPEKPEKIWSDKHPGPDVSMRIFKNRQEISKYVGYPVLIACEDLYDKNIRTVEAIWKKEEAIKYSNCVIIVIHYDSLSPENKEIASQIAQEQNTKFTSTQYKGEQMTICEIRVPVTETTAPEEIEKSLKDIVARFQNQEKTWDK